MKKFLFVLLSVILGLTMMAGCAPKEDVIEIYMPDGAPALSLVSLFDKETIGGEKVKFTVVPASNIAGYLKNGKADLAILPTNAAAIIFNQGYEYKYVAATSHGNLFMVGTEDIDGLQALKGKVVGIIGQGQVPDLIFRTLLSDAGIEYEVGEKATEGKVILRYAEDGGVLLPLIKKGTVDFGILGEPAVTTALGNIEGSKVVYDLQTAWGEDNGYPQAGLMARNSISDDFISALFDELEQNADYARDNADEACTRISEHMIESSETTVKKLTADTVTRCNIRLQKAEDCKADVIKFLTAFHKLDAASVGGKVPSDEFFRTVK